MVEPTAELTPERCPHGYRPTVRADGVAPVVCTSCALEHLELAEEATRTQLLAGFGELRMLFKDALEQGAAIRRDILPLEARLANCYQQGEDALRLLRDRPTAKAAKEVQRDLETLRLRVSKLEGKPTLRWRLADLMVRAAGYVRTGIWPQDYGQL